MANDQIIVRCDAEGCGWNEPLVMSEARKYHNAPCPNCGHAPVLSDADMEVLIYIAGLQAIGVVKYLDSETEPTDGWVQLHIDTAAFRK